ncbi:MAG TPA: CHAT domain-containing tetratricopeptide repeat protein [Thermoanaerobaculia bacterium]|jgi:tetratricopeptide (TPR) repeat protein|nr:CHAT domain-containing tetratricopeptide repeat protein [Thermoanaerobaculia bacterium]
MLRSAFAVLVLSSLPLTGQSIDRAIDLHTAGRLQEALREYHAVAAATERSDPAVAGTALNNSCLILMDLGDYRTALPDCRKALTLLRAAGDRETLSRALNNLGLVLQVLGEPAEAERSFREALAINRGLGDAEAQVINLSNLGALAVAAGRYSAAFALHTEAEAISTRHAGEPWAAEQVRVARLNQGVALEKMGAYREALGLYKGLLSESGEMDPGRRAALLVNTGVLYRNLGDPVRAVEAFREAVVEYRRMGDTAGVSNAWLNLGLAQHLNLERPGEAEMAFREALRLAEESGDRTEEVQDLFYLGRLLLERGRLDEAKAVYRRCLEVAEASGSAEGRWAAREGLGRIARARGDLAGALGHLERALSEIEQVRAGIARPRRAGYFGDKRAVYAAAVETLGALERREPGRGWGERGLAVVQRAKARDLLDALGSGRQPAAPLGAAELRARVREGAVLEYFLGESHLYLWVIGPGGIRFHDLGAKAPVLDAVTRLHHDLASGLDPKPNTMTALSRVLLGAARPPSRNGGPLRIAPDGALRYLPFELLEDPAAPGVPLIERRAVSYLPSASTLAALGHQDRSEGVRLLGIGDPVVTRKNGGSPTPRELLVERFGLAPLPASSREIASAARLLGGQAIEITGDRATKKALREAVARGARVVHLATHTVIDERPGRGAAILLTASDDDDGLLSPEEIAALDDRSDLTVLAACRTALGTGEEGQALASLTGSFLAAGSRSVLATLWDVGDAETAAFMEQFYFELGRGLPPAEALQAAKNRLRADSRWNRPSLWSGYVLIGDAPAVVPRRVPWAAWIAGAVAILLAALAFRRWGPAAYRT